MRKQSPKENQYTIFLEGFQSFGKRNINPSQKESEKDPKGGGEVSPTIDCRTREER